MKFTFGIITFDNQEARVATLVEKINKFARDAEIIVVGGTDAYDGNVNHIEFDEHEHWGWITRKKNIITENASYDNIVYMHDYFAIDESWQKGWEEFGDDWDVAMNVIKNKDGSRYRDWCAWDDPELCYFKYFFTRNEADIGGHFACLVPYDYKKTEHMYISGGYWVAKKKTMQKWPLTETLMAAESEDVDWSKRMRDSSKYVMNQGVTVHILKDDKDRIIPTYEEIEWCRNFVKENNLPSVIKKEDIWLL